MADPLSQVPQRFSIREQVNSFTQTVAGIIVPPLLEPLSRTQHGLLSVDRFDHTPQPRPTIPLNMRPCVEVTLWTW
jgi:hypothetical protein